MSSTPNPAPGFSAAALTAATRDVIIGGKTYTLSPPTLQDEAAHELWLQQRAFEIEYHSCAGNTNLLLALSDRVALIHFESSFAQRCWMTVAGSIQLVLLGLRAKHPLLTVADFSDRRLVADINAAREVMKELIFPMAARAQDNPGPKAGASDQTAPEKGAA